MMTDGVPNYCVDTEVMGNRISALIESIEAEIANCIGTLPIRHDRESVQYLFVIQHPRTSKELLHDMKL